SVAVVQVAVDGSLIEIGPGIAEVAHALVADIFDEVRFVQKLEDEGGVVMAEFAQLESCGAEHVHSASACARSEYEWRSAAGSKVQVLITTSCSSSVCASAFRRAATCAPVPTNARSRRPAIMLRSPGV